jgi:Uncharacterized conserved protein (DUF2278)
MPVQNYGVFTGTVAKDQREIGTGRVHFQFKMAAADDVIRVPVNVLSDAQGALESRLLKYIVIDNFRHPVTAAIEALGDGWHPIEHKPGGAALDYRRGNLFNEADMRIASPDPVDLTGWQIADKAKEKCAVPSVPLVAGKTLEVPLVKPCVLSNNGGIITLLDATGTKVSGVSYTKEQAHDQGWTVTF